jgi:uroporphyrinogen III methyltransferase/synthase
VTVYLVGAGPGDPGLITVRGAEVLSRADVVVHDRLSDAELLELAPETAERIDVGKRPGAPVDQAAINALLVDRGRRGLEVVRLKGGDPFVFGRGGEEAAALQAAGVPFEVVPGVTAAVAVPAYAGVPVTHRGLAASFTVVTGHRQDPGRGVDWAALARTGGTLVILMGVAHRAEIAEQLLGAGCSPDTPVVAVCRGTRPEQRSVRTTLAGLAHVALEPPATVVVGAVAGLDLSWFERRPLLGWRVVVPRAEAQAGPTAAALREAGADVVRLPVIEVVEPADGGAGLRRAAVALGSYAWVVFTSQNAVAALWGHLRDARDLGSAKVAAIGPATAGALRSRGVVADLVPSSYVAEALVEAFPPPEEPGARVLLPRAGEARDVLPVGLRKLGFEVDVVEAYRVRPAHPPEASLAAAAEADAIVFTSPSTVRAFLETAGAERLPRVVACIGPVTADAAAAAGVRVDAVAEEHTTDGLVAALAAFASGDREAKAPAEGPRRGPAAGARDGSGRRWPRSASGTAS